MRLHRSLALVCFALSTLPLLAQDDYHAGLLSELMSEHDLPAGEWLFYGTEEQNLRHAFHYTATRSNDTIADQNFGRVVTLRTRQAYPNPWDAGYNLTNVAAVDRGDVILVVFSIRSEGGPGRALVKVERRTDFAQEVTLSLDVGINWETYYISFEAQQGNYARGGFQLSFQIGQRQQEIQLGGVTGINFGDSVSLADVPSNLRPEEYEGFEADAPWRAAAAQRIDALRMADLRIEAVDSMGAPAPDVRLRVEQKRHEFAFGTAVKACRLAGNDCSDATFVDRLTDLDGRGHGFNWAVFENDLKWPAWEQEWFATNEEVAAATQWLRARGITVRGHNLLWPGRGNLPGDVDENFRDTGLVLTRIREHIAELGAYPGIGGEITEWDVLNETVTNTRLAAGFAGLPGYPTGRELYVEVFEAAREAFPEAALYINDYVTVSTQSGPEDASYRAIKRNVGELVAAGAPIDGVGFQGHVGGRPNGIPSVLATFDDFYEAYGLEAKVTEFDLATSISDELGAKYMADFMTATFSHPSMTGILFWNFWDVDTWQHPQANLFDADWNRTPAGDAYVDLVFDRWWTRESPTTDAGGVATVRAFKGRHVVSYGCGGELRTDTVELADDLTVRVVCDDFASGVRSLREGPAFRLSPNPTSGFVRVDHAYGAEVDLEVYNAVGQRVYAGVLGAGGGTLPLALDAGAYTVRLAREGYASVRSLIVR